MTISIDSSVILGYYQAKTGQSPNASGSSSTGSSSASTKPTNPTPPWTGFTTVQANALTRSVLDGARFIDPAAAKLDVTGADATANQNYKNLFALHQGLDALSGIAQQAGAKGVSSGELARLQKAFQSGMQQVQSYLSSNPFTGFQVVQGAVSTVAKTTTGVQHETDTYDTGPIYSGSSSNEIPAFQGDVKFDLTVTRVSGSQGTVNFDLSEMGSTPRTMGNVVSYLNGKLEDAGFATRFASVRTPAVPNTVQVGGKTVTLSPGQDQFGLQIKGVSVEDLSFSAPASDPAVYVTQTSGITSGKAADATQQLVKFDASAAPVGASAASGQVFKQDLGANTAAVHAVATAPDGSVYVLTDVNATTNGQPLQGAQDVALVKYDSAGHVVFTRTLGAADSASGLALAVSADGSQVAIAGSATGDLTPGDGVTKQTSSGQPVNSAFVTVFDSLGEEQWTKQTAAVSGASVQANAVGFGANGVVYVAGQTDGALSGSASDGRTDGYIQAFHAVSEPLNDGSGDSQWVVTNSYTSQFGTGSQDKATGLVVSGSSVYVSSAENGHAVVRQFDASGTGSASLTPSAVRDLGDLQGGSVAGIAVNQDGSIIVAGATHNGALDAGTITQGYAGGQEAFIASLAPDLQPASSDTLTYVGSSTDQNVTGVTASGGQVYITGQIVTTPPPGGDQTSAFDGYASAVDAQTGQVSWTQRYQGQDREMSTAGIAVGQTGSTVLDKLGLPSGAIDFSVSKQLVANSSVRAGDEFFVKSGTNGHPVAVKITADDTYQSLAQKISRASGFNASATALVSTKGDQLQIKPTFKGAQVQIIAGPTGADALKALGLQEGVVSGDADQMSALAPVKGSANAKPTTSIKNGYALQLASSFDITTAAGVKTAMAALSSAMSTIRSIYKDMTTAPPPKTPAAGSGSVPKYLTDQIASYQAALNRLTSGG